MRLFDEVTHDQKNTLLAVGKRCVFPNRALLIRQDDSANGIFIILSGVVESIYFSDTGRDLRLARWSKYDFVGAPHIFGTVPQRWSASAVGTVDALHLSQDNLRGLIASDPEFAETLIICLGDKGDRYSKLAQNLAFHTVSQRLARALVSACDTAQTESLWRASPLELSREIGSTRQAVGAILKVYEKEGLITRQRDSISVLNVPELRKLAGIDPIENRH
ncbi:Crp/Fnr family transcriptional regulator [Pacificibacter sp. AS14]|uniref:Crp/Fnr family transcriptional regulator n=1 Tax=Pacificibacter sp. AS14 TaxID=3135785 RepID=UPI0031781FEE